MTEEVNPHFSTFLLLLAESIWLPAVLWLWPVINWLMFKLINWLTDFAGVSDRADEVIWFYIYLLTLVLAWETQSCLLQMAFISLLPKQMESSLKNWHPKCNHSQLQAWSYKNCCSCFKVNYFKAFQFQKLYIILRVEQCEPHDCRANLIPANQVFSVIPFFSRSSQLSSAVSAPHFHISLVKRKQCCFLQLHLCPFVCPWTCQLWKTGMQLRPSPGSLRDSDHYENNHRIPGWEGLQGPSSPNFCGKSKV